MLYKYLKEKGCKIPKQKYKLTNWSEYNESLKRRGNIEIWLSQEIINNWNEQNRIYDGTGTPDYYTDLAIITCHEIRKVFRLPLRQCEGFINSIFNIMGLNITCPSFSVLSKRLERLNIRCPRYRQTYRPDDSTGLKRFGRGEWHQKKHKVSAKRKRLKER